MEIFLFLFSIAIAQEWMGNLESGEGSGEASRWQKRMAFPVIKLIDYPECQATGLAGAAWGKGWVAAPTEWVSSGRGCPCYLVSSSMATHPPGVPYNLP